MSKKSESFINISNFSIENLENLKSNGSIRFFLGKTCILSQINGPNNSNHAKNSEKMIIDVQINMDRNNNIKNQKSMEYSIMTILSSIISLEDYPGSILKINLTVFIDDGSIFAALFNSTIISLLINGITMKSTAFCYNISINKLLEIERLLYFPNTEEEKIANNLINIIYDINEGKIISFVSYTSIDKDILKEINDKCLKENHVFSSIIKQFLLNN